jgi:mercuric ion binding protein
MRYLGLIIIVGLVTGCTAPMVESGVPLTGEKAVLTIHGMSCPLCANNINGRLMKEDGVQKVQIDMKTGLVTVFFEADNAPTSVALKRAVKESGFTLKEIETE